MTLVYVFIAVMLYGGEIIGRGVHSTMTLLECEETRMEVLLDMPDPAEGYIAAISKCIEIPLVHKIKTIEL